MNLRTRLIVAFFLLSVVPLCAVTLYSYRSNAEALRAAAERETDLLAGELGQRMSMVTTQLSERVEHLMDIAALEEQVERIAETRAEPDAAAPPVDIGQTVVHTLGEAAMLLQNVELLGARGRGRSIPRPPPVPTAPGRDGGAARRDRPPGPPAELAGIPKPERGGLMPPDRAGMPTPDRSGMPPAPPPPPSAGSRVTAQADGQAQGQGQGRGTAQVQAAPTPQTRERTLIDMGPIRREMMRGLIPDGKQFENLTPQERERLGRELNARMLGIAEGIKLGAAELQKQADAAKRRQEALPRTPPTTTRPQQKKTALSGNKLGVTVEEDGKIVRQVNAEIHLPNVLATVFSTTRRERGEVPFAVSTDGRVYTRSDDDRVLVEGLGPVATFEGPATARVNDWVVVTTKDPSGAGLRLGIATPVGDSLADLRKTAARNLAVGFGFCVLALAGIFPLSRRLTRPLHQLSGAVLRIADGDYSARVPVNGRDEFGRLAIAFNQMATDVEHHQRAAIEQERLKRELELGRQIQNEMLPHAPLKLGLTEIEGVSVPANEVGGDFFNYFVLPTGQVALLVGDVSGKGVGAALLMANVQASLRTRLSMGQGLSEVADEIDRDIEANSPGPLYATLFVGIFDPASRLFRYVNAGHHPQYVLRGDRLQRLASTGLPVGLFPGRRYEERQVQLEAGDLLFFYTDGCVEAENEAQEPFGAERLEGLLAGAAATPADVLIRVEAAMKTFRGRREPFDDATMMAVKVG